MGWRLVISPREGARITAMVVVAAAVALPGALKYDAW
jgi:hypothetical protein